LPKGLRIDVLECRAVMQRLIHAFVNSLRALRVLARTEKAVQQELALLAAAIPLGWLLAASWEGYMLLIGSLLLLIIVEVLNTGIEATCNAISREFQAEIQLAKDCGSLAVLLTIVIAASIWGTALYQRLSAPTP